jgi:hypothetical protein
MQYNIAWIPCQPLLLLLAAGQHDKISSHRRWSHTKELATSWHGRTAPLLNIEQRNRGSRPSVLCVVGGTPGPPLGPPAGGTQSRGLRPVRCASAGAGRPECGLRAGPAVRAIPQAKKKKKKKDKGDLDAKFDWVCVSSFAVARREGQCVCSWPGCVAVG